MDLIALAGYMRLLSPEFVAAFRGKSSEHSSIVLPAFPGLLAQRQAAGIRGQEISGVLCTGSLRRWIRTDRQQAAVPVEEGDPKKAYPPAFCARNTGSILKLSGLPDA